MRKWTTEEEQQLRALSSQKNTEEIALELNRSYPSVEKKLSRLGLVSKKKEIPIEKAIQIEHQRQEDVLNRKKLEYLVEENRFLKKEVNSLLSVGEIETCKIQGDKLGGDKEAVAIVLASDWHYEELVKKSQTNGLNEFNLIIARRRIETFFSVISQLIAVHQKEYKIDTLILALLGDFISGTIHEDLMESNQLSPTEAIWEVQNIIASGIEHLLKETDVNLIIPCSVGNHSRVSAKQRVSTEFGNSLEMLMYKNLQNYFNKEKRVKMIINDAYLNYLDVYGYVCRFHHGHSIKYAGGVGGIFIPAYKAISQWNKSRRADYDFFAHFHQLKDGGNFICNGSIIGFNAYAIKIKADYEEPKQAFVILSKKRGIDVVRKINLK